MDETTPLPAVGHQPDCYPCQGTGLIVGFGLSGRTCPAHHPDCDPDRCHPDCADYDIPRNLDEWEPAFAWENEERTR